MLKLGKRGMAGLEPWEGGVARNKQWKKGYSVRLEKRSQNKFQKIRHLLAPLGNLRFVERFLRFLFKPYRVPLFPLFIPGHPSLPWLKPSHPSLPWLKPGHPPSSMVQAAREPPLPTAQASIIKPPLADSPCGPQGGVWRGRGSGGVSVNTVFTAV